MVSLPIDVSTMTCTIRMHVQYTKIFYQLGMRKVSGPACYVFRVCSFVRLRGHVHKTMCHAASARTNYYQCTSVTPRSSRM